MSMGSNGKMLMIVVKNWVCLFAGMTSIMHSAMQQYVLEYTPSDLKWR
jgi:hypothetical protein